MLSQPHSNGRGALAAFIRKTTTQANFARDLGISQSHLSLILAGRRAISFRLAKRIAEATGVELSDLPDKVAAE
jgi:transcriptional regulator with XRE-family HTH domain